MLSNERIRPIVLLFLLFCVLSSKKIIIYNEETLVAISFAAFVLFVYHYFGSTLSESLNLRGNTIKQELQSFITLKQESLQHLLEEHKRVAGLKQSFTMLSASTQGQLLPIGKSSSQHCNRVLIQQIKQKLHTLASSRGNLQQRLQQSMAKSILPLVLVQINRVEKKSKGARRGKGLNPGAIRNAINLFKSSR